MFLGKDYKDNIHHGLVHSNDLLAKSFILAAFLGKTEKIDWKVLTAAIFLHDIFAHACKFHGQQAADLIDKNLSSIPEFPPEKIEKIKEAVVFHDKKSAGKKKNSIGLETKILYDIDNLDAFGTKGIYRYFAAFITRGIKENKIDEQILGQIKDEVLNNVIFRYESLYFDKSRQLGKDDFSITRLFFERLNNEKYLLSDRQGATGVFTFIRNYIDDDPRSISRKAIQYYRSMEHKAGFAEGHLFARNYFICLEQMYCNVKTELLLSKLFDTGLAGQINDTICLIERYI